TLWALLCQEPRWAVGRQVRAALNLAGTRHGTGMTGAEDAGRIDYARLRPQDLWALRVRAGDALSQAHPAPAPNPVPGLAGRCVPGPGAQAGGGVGRDVVPPAGPGAPRARAKARRFPSPARRPGAPAAARGRGGRRGRDSAQIPATPRRLSPGSARPSRRWQP